MKLQEVINIETDSPTVLDWQKETRKSLNRLMKYRARLEDDFRTQTVLDFEKEASDAITFEIEDTAFKPDYDMDGEWFEMAEITEVFSFALDAIGESERGAFGRRIMNTKAGYAKRLYDLQYRANKAYSASEKRHLL